MVSLVRRMLNACCRCVGRYIDLSGNAFEGTLPASLSALSRVQYVTGWSLYLSVSCTYCNCFVVPLYRFLSLAQNAITGVLPAGFTALTALT